MIHFKHVNKYFAGRPAVEDLSLHIAEGEFTVLIGTSGSGEIDHAENDQSLNRS